MTKKEIKSALRGVTDRKEAIAILSQYEGRIDISELLSGLGYPKSYTKALKKQILINIKKKEDERISKQYEIFSNVCGGVSKKKFLENIDSAWDYKRIVERGTEISFGKFISNLPYSRYFDSKFGLSLNKFIKAYRMAWMILQRYRNSDYSMGARTVLNVSGEEIKVYDDRMEYSRSCKYGATHGYTEIDMTKSDLLNMEIVEGLYTVKLKDHRCKWLVSDGSHSKYNVFFKHGYIWHNSHSETLEEAKELHRKRKIADTKARMSENAIFNKIKHKFIGVDHLKSAGACAAGIKSAINQLNIDTDNIGGIRVDYLLKIANDNKIEPLVRDWVRRAL